MWTIRPCAESWVMPMMPSVPQGIGFFVAKLRSVVLHSAEREEVGGETSIAIAPCSSIHEGRPLQWSKYRNGDNMCYEIKPQETPVSFLYVSLPHL